MKAVLISMQPQWCERIYHIIRHGDDGIPFYEKSVEIRKTKPKIKTPFVCYIYQTRMKWAYTLLRTLKLDTLADALLKGLGRVIGEFVCDKIYDIRPHHDIPTFCNQYECGWKSEEVNACLSFDELNCYLGGKNGFGWHISNLVIYEKPKELSEFEGLRKTKFGYEPIKITRPPQSWCYVEELK